MKGLVYASIEKQTHLESELKLAEYSEVMRTVPVNAVIWDLMAELKSAKSEISRLSEMNRCLRSGVAMTIPPPVQPLKSTAKLEAELTAARKQIVAMDLELARMNNLRFEDDERIREYEDVLDCVMGRSGVVDIPAVHPRFHPMATCLDPACKKYANRLRNGMRQAVAEVRDFDCVFVCFNLKLTPNRPMSKTDGCAFTDTTAIKSSPWNSFVMRKTSR